MTPLPSPLDRPGVVHVGLGPLGRIVLADLLERDAGRIVAAVDCDPALVGRPLAELLPGTPGIPAELRVVPGVEAVGDWSGIRAGIVTTTSDLELCAETLRFLLQKGVSVVSTCEELSWPWLRHPVIAQELHELAVRARVRVLGTGVNPGFLMDALPVALTTACRSVRSLRVERVQDASKRRRPFQRKIGAALDPAEFERRASAGSLRHVGLGESLHFVAHSLGWKLERWEETLEPVLADAPLESAVGPIAPGQARGVRQVARGYVSGKPVCELVFHAAVGEPDPRDRIVVDGDPPLEMTLAGGVHGDVATSAVVVNSLRALLVAEPGLHTMASLPLTGAR